MAKFKLVDTERVRTVYATKASATEIDAGSLVELDTGLIAEADEASTAVAFLMEDAVDGSERALVTVGDDFVLECLQDSEDDFAANQRGTVCDITGTQTLDNTTSSTDVMKIDISKDAGTIDSKEGIRVKINKPLF